MTLDQRVLNVLIKIIELSESKKLSFEDKLSGILNAIVNGMMVKSGSIMMLKNRKTLEVVASTKQRLVGVTQSMDVDSPSTWVVKKKRPLYVDGNSGSDFSKRYTHYKGNAFYVIPLISTQGVIGVISLTEKIGTDVFAPQEREILLNIVGQVITTLDNIRLNETLKKQKKTLQVKNAELKKLEKLRTDLFNMLIHDLKGPLSETVANLDILSYLTEGEILEYVSAALNGCHTLYSMVSNLLDIARLEESRLELVYEAVSAEELIEEALARLIVSGKKKELQFEKKIPGQELIVNCDRSLMIRVLQNLISNAVQYSPQGGTIEIGVTCLENEAGFFIKDSGPGIPENYQSEIFNKYSQLEKKSDGRVYTVGLGLYFCRIAVEAHGGSISVESEYGKGSRFFFSVPFSQPGQSGAKKKSAKQKQTG